jgi:hypothetical protein
MLVIAEVCDLCIPIAGFRNGANPLKTSFRDFYRSYRPVSFPRTFIALLVPVIITIDDHFSAGEVMRLFMEVGFTLLWAAFMAFDTYRAFRENT